MDEHQTFCAKPFRKSQLSSKDKIVLNVETTAWEAGKKNASEAI